MNNMQFLSKKLFISLLIILIIVLVAAIILVLKINQYKNPESPSKYAAVYLQTGEIYFGEFSWFPWPKLKNVWYLQRSIDNQNQPQVSIVAFKNSFWGPIDKIYLNPKQVIWITYLKNSSQLTTYFNNPELLKQNVQGNVNSTQSQNTGASGQNILPTVPNLSTTTPLATSTKK